MTTTVETLARRHRADVIAGLNRQPGERVRIGYWLATDLHAIGITVDSIGTDEARGGFIARTLTGTVLYRPALVDDGTPTGALAYHLAQMSFPERDHLRRLLADPPISHRCADPLPGFFHQPRRPVRIAYWLAKNLQEAGTSARAGGPRNVTGAGASVTSQVGEATNPSAAGDSGTTARALARHIGTLSHAERESLARILDR